jgi:TetR/AcrR family transcriptional repressor of bet genes
MSQEACPDGDRQVEKGSMKRKAMIGARRPERRAEIVSAARRVIEQKGFEGASLRAIARELGCTTGVLMHHFVSKEDLLRAALEAIFRPFDERLVNAKRGADRLEGMREMLLYFLPIDEPKRATVRLWLWIVLRAAVDQSLAFDYRQRSGVLRVSFNELLAEGQKTGELRADFDPSVEADTLFALVDGLAIHALAVPERFPSERLVALVDRQLERLINPKARSQRRTQQDSHATGSPCRAVRSRR